TIMYSSTCTCIYSFFFFFFQAEDGIRDFHVTGVQTCALPISHYLPSALFFTGAVSFAMMMQNSSINTYIQTHTMSAYRGRIMSYYVMAFQGIFPIGSLLTGAIAEWIGLKNTLYLMG